MTNNDSFLSFGKEIQSLMSLITRKQFSHANDGAKALTNRVTIIKIKSVYTIIYTFVFKILWIKNYSCEFKFCVYDFLFDFCEPWISGVIFFYAAEIMPEADFSKPGLLLKEEWNRSNWSASPFLNEHRTENLRLTSYQVSEWPRESFYDFCLSFQKSFS